MLHATDNPEERRREEHPRDDPKEHERESEDAGFETVHEWNGDRQRDYRNGSEENRAAPEHEYG